jgi:hypothetical protein
MSQGHPALAPGGMHHIEHENSTGLKIANNVTAIGSPSWTPATRGLASKPAG